MDLVTTARVVGGRTVVMERVASGLRAVGALDVPITVERVAQIPRTALGKAPLIRRQADVLPSPHRAASPEPVEVG